MKSHRQRIHVMLAAALLAVGGRVHAQPAPVPGLFVTVDEFGHGFARVAGLPVLTFTSGIRPDPGPGGLPAVLTYDLPAVFAAMVPGDVRLHDLDVPGAPFLDVLRFNVIGGFPTLLFYSDNIGGADAPADTPSPPLAFYANVVDIDEVGPEGQNGAVYTPGPNDPGFLPGSIVQYVFVSDGVIPEPSTVVLLGSGLLGLAVAARRRRAPR